MKIYGDYQSGNCYKIALTAALLNIEHQWIDIDILAGDTKKADFLALNPNGKIPLLVLDDGRTLSESNAIINYLAHGSQLASNDAFVTAKIQQWQFFEQYSHEPYVAVARFINKYLGLPQERLTEYQAKQAGGNKALAIMEQQLTRTPYLVGEQLTLADISLFAYTHVAEEGGFDLTQYPAIQAWIKRIEQQPQFLAIQ